MNGQAAPPKYNLDGIFSPEQAHPDDAHSILMRLIPPNSRVLELGCASGYLSGYMENQLNCRVTGLEVDAPSAAIAATRCSEVHVVDLDALEALEVVHAGAPYDVLLAAAVLEHLRNPERLLQRARELLTPQARLIVSLPNIAHWGIRLRLLFGEFNYTDYGIMDRTHVHFYTVKTGRTLIETSGYAVDRFLVAGSGLQNLMNTGARFTKRDLPAPVLPGLLGYELIYAATPLIKP